MPKVIDILGQRFERLVVVSYAGVRNHRALWNCQCDCGNKTVVRGASLRSGHIKGCGCLNGERHGGRLNPEYMVWRGMRSRCMNSRAAGYKYYGGRGIKVCERWANSFANFIADVGARPSSKHSLDRIDVNGNYEPGNVRWATWSQQALNKRLSLKRISERNEARRLLIECADLIERLIVRVDDNAAHEQFEAIKTVMKERLQR